MTKKKLRGIPPISEIFTIFFLVFSRFGLQSLNRAAIGRAIAVPLFFPFPTAAVGRVNAVLSTIAAAIGRVSAVPSYVTIFFKKIFFLFRSGPKCRCRPSE